jgi:hypothetical protein
VGAVELVLARFQAVLKRAVLKGHGFSRAASIVFDLLL